MRVQSSRDGGVTGSLSSWQMAFQIMQFPALDAPVWFMRLCRILAGVIGGFVVSYSAMTLASLSLAAAGMDKIEAVHLSLLCGPPLFLFLMIWVAATRHVLKVGVGIITAGLLLPIAASLFPTV